MISSLLNLITNVGLIPLIVMIVLYLLNDIDVANTLEWVFMVLFPNFCLGQGITKYYMNDFLRDTCSPTPEFCKKGKKQKIKMIKGLSLILIFFRSLY